MITIVQHWLWTPHYCESRLATSRHILLLFLPKVPTPHRLFPRWAISLHLYSTLLVKTLNTKSWCQRLFWLKDQGSSLLSLIYSTGTTLTSPLYPITLTHNLYPSALTNHPYPPPILTHHPYPTALTHHLTPPPLPHNPCPSPLPQHPYPSSLLHHLTRYQRGHSAQYSGFKLATSTFVLSILEFVLNRSITPPEANPLEWVENTIAFSLLGSRASITSCQLARSEPSRMGRALTCNNRLRTLTKELAIINQWLLENSLYLHKGETECVLFVQVLG